MLSRVSRAAALIAVLFCIFVLLPPAPLRAAELFRYKYQTGEQYIIKSTIQQQVQVGSKRSYSASFDNWINVKVLAGDENGGTVMATYRVLERVDGEDQIFTANTQYQTTTYTDAYGVDTVPQENYQPMVRNVPRFPEYSVEVGDRWTFPAQEVYDLRKLFGIPDPYRFEILVNYRYLGEMVSTRDGKSYPAFEISYPINHSRRVMLGRREVRVSLRGQTKQMLLWDREKGRPHSYSEEYDFKWSGPGQNYSYIGTAQAYITQEQTEEIDELASALSVELKQAEIRDVEVRADDSGVIITVGNILICSRFYCTAPRREHPLRAAVGNYYRVSAKTGPDNWSYRRSRHPRRSAAPLRRARAGYLTPSK